MLKNGWQMGFNSAFKGINKGVLLSALEQSFDLDNTIGLTHLRENFEEMRYRF
jgi:hypothetical protein